MRIQNSARNSTEWFETLDRYTGFSPIQFAYSLLTRSQRVSHKNLRLRDAAWLETVERWFAASAGLDEAVPPLLRPYRLRSMTLQNRIVVSPVLTYQAEDGLPGDFHFVHYCARAWRRRAGDDRDDRGAARGPQYRALPRPLQGVTTRK
ncbi:hypothetical protein [Sphingobium sp. BS19]|uniref:hypothetical protein n=1 Tax=Sphingobium sp. BS19 TaxID=3018973 RepID=UPI002491EF35|nr:hypothetical protein [Sphingobium sp. BS19]